MLTIILHAVPATASCFIYITMITLGDLSWGILLLQFVVLVKTYTQSAGKSTLCQAHTNYLHGSQEV